MHVFVIFLAVILLEKGKGCFGRVRLPQTVEVARLLSAKPTRFAPTDLLHERYQKREQRIVSKTEFEEMLDRDRRMGLTALIGAANAVIDNSSDFEMAVQQFQNMP